MRLTGDWQDWTVSQAALGRILNLTPGRISQLVDEKIVTLNEADKNGVCLVESLQNYWQSKQSREDGKGKVNFWEERGLHERAKRKMAELKLRKMKGELYAADAVDAAIFEILTNFRNKFTGVAAKLSPQLAGKNQNAIYDILNAEIEDLLNELAGDLEGANFNEEDSVKETDDGD